MATAENEYESLCSLFDDQLKIFKDIENSCLDTNSKELQDLVSKCITTLEKATLQVSQLGLFSSNENYEEIPMESLKFLLLPVLLASLTLKKVGESRIEICQVATIYFKDFLQRCRDYEITNLKIPQEDSDEDEITDRKVKSPRKGRPTPQELQMMSRQRDDKIKRYKEKKSLENSLKELQAAFEKSSRDEEVRRNYFLTMVKQFILISFDELDSLSMEKNMLKQIEAMRQNGQEIKPVEVKKGSFQPFLITKDKVQKSVFGQGYPSLPILSVDELYEQRVRDGIFPPNTGAPPNATKIDSSVVTTYEEREVLEQETKEENDDKGELERLRERDEWRDTNRTGWGNTYNRS